MCRGHSRDEILKSIRRIVVDEGNTHLMMIQTGGPKLGAPGYTPDFTYTIGMWHNFGAPELVMFAANPAMLNTVRDKVREGMVIHPHKRYSGLAKGLDTVFAEIQKPDQIFVFTRLFYAKYGSPADRKFPRMQLVWPDEFNVFPWEDGFNDHFRPAQLEVAQWPEKGAKV